MKVRVKDLSKIVPAFQKAIGEAQRQAVIAASHKLLGEVRRRIPDEGGWYDIYKDALKVVEVDGVIKVVGDAEIAITTMPADKTVLFVEGNSAAAIVLQVQNPWPVDMLPAIKGGLKASVRAVPSSISETNTLRERLFPQMSVIKKALVDAGATVIDNGIPKINGKTYVDMNFLSLRLEHGLGPFSRLPHWRPAANKAKDFLREVAPEIQSLLDKTLQKELK